MINFNIFSQVATELDAYFNKKIKIGGGSKTSKRKPYEFSQYDTIEVVDYYTNSKFELGDKDSTGQQKFFLNEVAFRADVASKNIDFDVKHFTFIPEEDQAEYGAIFLRKMFRKWAKQYNFGEMLNNMVENFPKYGSIVVQRKGKEVEEINLQKLRVQQDAKDLATADYVILDNGFMTITDMEEYKDWDVSGIEGNWDTKYQVLTRYGRVPLAWYKDYKGESYSKGDEKKTIDVMAVIAPDAESKDPDGKVLFCEEIDERPFLECHYARQHGRWLGIGEVEKQFENQKIRNMVFNLRKQAVAWSAKNIFQTQDDIVINSLVREVKDGDILKISTPNGVTRVDTTNRASGDFNSIDTLVTDNANQRSFTFEVATGEQLKSNTPFRLGALQSEETNKYFSGKRERLGLLLTQIVTDFKIPQFEKELDDEITLAVFANDEEFDKLREAKKNVLKGQSAVNKILADDFEGINEETLNGEIDGALANKEMDTYTITKDEIKNLKYTVAVETTGESIDIPQKMETLVTLYQSMVQAQDPRAETVLKKIMALAGEKLPAKPAMPNMQGMGQGGGQGMGLTANINPNATGQTEEVI